MRIMVTGCDTVTGTKNGSESIFEPPMAENQDTALPAIPLPRRHERLFPEARTVADYRNIVAGYLTNRNPTGKKVVPARNEIESRSVYDLEFDNQGYLCVEGFDFEGRNINTDDQPDQPKVSSETNAVISICRLINIGLPGNWLDYETLIYSSRDPSNESPWEGDLMIGTEIREINKLLNDCLDLRPEFIYELFGWVLYNLDSDSPDIDEDTKRHSGRLGLFLLGPVARALRAPDLQKWVTDLSFETLDPDLYGYCLQEYNTVIEPIKRLIGVANCTEEAVREYMVKPDSPIQRLFNDATRTWVRQDDDSLNPIREYVKSAVKKATFIGRVKGVCSFGKKVLGEGRSNNDVLAMKIIIPLWKEGFGEMFISCFLNYLETIEEFNTTNYRHSGDVALIRDIYKGVDGIARGQELRYSRWMIGKFIHSLRFATNDPELGVELIELADFYANAHPSTDAYKALHIVMKIQEVLFELRVQFDEDAADAEDMHSLYKRGKVSSDEYIRQKRLLHSIGYLRNKILREI